ncbi:MAG: ABC-type branched-chain amino acid transport system, permease component [Ilumatobacteraceae bacterium]|nr:ABC-type branched-chain amino acid transport system, permease component [Ilumatobacteraceae bacterium]
MSRRRDLELQLPAALRPLGPYVPAIGIIVLQLVLFPIGLGTWILGVVVGLLTALVALGLALIYRSNRILNFAQADLGAVPVTLAVGLIAASGLPYLAGLLIGLTAAIVLGAVVELAIIRRFFKAPRLLLTVATIGLSQLLVICGLLLPRLWDEEDTKKLQTNLSVPQPFTARIEIGSQIFHGAEVLAMIVAPLVLIALVLFLRGTDAGIALRASADRTDRAALLGIPVRRLQTLVWGLAAALSFTGLFLEASMFGYTGASALSAGALVFALSALLIGRLDNLVAVAASAVALRVLDQGVAAKYPSDPARIYIVLAVVLLVILALRRVSTRRRDVDGATLQAADEVRPVPAELRSVPVVRILRVLIPVVLVVLAAALPLVLGPSDELRASTVAAYALIALSVVVLTGWAGQVSLGQMAFAAVGAAVGAVATATWHVDLLVGLLAAGAAGAVVAVIVGLPALRQPGLYLAVTTLAFSLACSNFLLNRKEQAWIPKGEVAARPLFRQFDLGSEAAMYEVVLGVVVLAFLAVLGIRRSRTGRALIAVRDNERGAAAYSIPVLRAKLTAFALSGFLAAVAGCLLVHVNRGFDEGPFAASGSLGIFTAAVVGGLGSLAGAILGALYLQGGEWFLDPPWNLLPSAIGVLLVLMIVPGGLGNLMYRARDGALRALARRRGIVVASLLEDSGGDEAPEAIKVVMPDRPQGLDGSAADEPVGSPR